MGSGIKLNNTKSDFSIINQQYYRMIKSIVYNYCSGSKYDHEALEQELLIKLYECYQRYPEEVLPRIIYKSLVNRILRLRMKDNLWHKRHRSIGMDYNKELCIREGTIGNDVYGYDCVLTNELMFDIISYIERLQDDSVVGCFTKHDIDMWHLIKKVVKSGVSVTPTNLTAAIKSKRIKMVTVQQRYLRLMTKIRAMLKCDDVQALVRKFERKTTVINIRSGAEYDILIAAPSIYANPFHISKSLSREACIKLFKKDFDIKIKKNKQFRQAVMDLKGQRLGCYCKPLKCHGDVYVKWLEGET